MNMASLNMELINSDQLKIVKV